jgi:hypothetical protein
LGLAVGAEVGAARVGPAVGLEVGKRIREQAGNRASTMIVTVHVMSQPAQRAADEREVKSFFIAAIPLQN